MLILGIDPGGSGAFVTYDSETRRVVTAHDMPVWYQKMSAKRNRKRKRIDMIALAELFDMYEMLGVELVCMEAVGGRTGQGAAAGFVFGYGVGLIYAAAFYSRFVVETIPPVRWKKLMNVPGKANADDTAIMQRAGEMFPLDMHHFRGPNGGKRVDRAEAAMLAKFGADYVLPTRDKNNAVDTELRLAFERSDTGA